MKVYNQKDALREDIYAAFGLEASLDGGWDACVLEESTPKGIAYTPDEVASRVGEVDLLVRDGDVYTGHNTFYMALFTAIYRAGLFLTDKKVVILGDGRRARTASALAKELGAKEVVALGDAPGGVWNLQKHHDTQVIIRVCPVKGDAPMPCESLEHLPYLVGVVECAPLPMRTRLLEEAERADVHTVQGLYMAVAEAAIIAGLIQKENPSPTEIGKVNKSIQTKYANIVLVGMEGCGAKAVADCLARHTGREIVRVPAIQESVVRAGGLTGRILLVSEGVATNKDYAYTLGQNGRVYFFVRPLEQLVGHPLSGEALDQRYRDLLPGFRAFAEETQSYFGDPEVPTKELLQNFEALPYKPKE